MQVGIIAHLPQHETGHIGGRYLGFQLAHPWAKPVPVITAVCPLCIKVGGARDGPVQPAGPNDAFLHFMVAVKVTHHQGHQQIFMKRGQHCVAVIGPHTGQTNQAFYTGILHRGDNIGGAFGAQLILVHQWYSKRNQHRIVVFDCVFYRRLVQHIAFDQMQVFMRLGQFLRTAGEGGHVVALIQRLGDDMLSNFYQLHRKL